VLLTSSGMLYAAKRDSFHCIKIPIAEASLSTVPSHGTEYCPGQALPLARMPFLCAFSTCACADARAGHAPQSQPASVVEEGPRAGSLSQSDVAISIHTHHFFSGVNKRTKGANSNDRLDSFSRQLKNVRRHHGSEVVDRGRQDLGRADLLVLLHLLPGILGHVIQALGRQTFRKSECKTPHASLRR